MLSLCQFGISVCNVFIRLLGLSLLVFVSLVPLAVVYGYVLCSLWDWYVIPVGGINIDMLHAIGVALLALFVSHYDTFFVIKNTQKCSCHCDTNKPVITASVDIDEITLEKVIAEIKAQEDKPESMFSQKLWDYIRLVFIRPVIILGIGWIIKFFA